jgi:hypothetical protein
VYLLGLSLSGRRSASIITSLDPINTVRDQPSDDEDADDCEANCCEVVVKIAYGAPKASASSKPELIASQIKGLQSPHKHCHDDGRRRAFLKITDAADRRKVIELAAALVRTADATSSPTAPS